MKKRRNYIILLVSLSFIMGIVTVISFVHTNKVVRTMIGTGPESGWTFFFLGIPKYIPILLMLGVTITLVTGTIVYACLQKKKTNDVFNQLTNFTKKHGLRMLVWRPFPIRNDVDQLKITKLWAVRVGVGGTSFKAHYVN